MSFGIGFFRANSVMYDLVRQQIGVTTAVVQAPSVPEIAPADLATVLAVAGGALALLEFRWSRGADESFRGTS